MNNKIIFWLTTSLVNFGITKFIKEKHECEIYAIADIVDKQKSFYEKQKLVKFQKIWYYHDYISKAEKDPDLKYLETIEKNYKINLWLLACNERIFYNFNDFHKFSELEVLSILEQECKLFENILNQVKPNFVIMGTPIFHQEQIFYEICKSKRISVLMLESTNFGYRYMITDGTNNFLKQSKKSQTKSLKELQDYLKGFNPTKQGLEFKKTFQISKLNYFKAAIKFLLSNNTNVRTHYSYYGRTKINVIFKMLIYTLKKRYRENFIDRNLSREIDDSGPFIYFPLHIEQERVLLMGAPFYTNQFEVITNIVKSLPIGYRLLVKEHPIQAFRGWRSISTYKKIMELPNVKLLHPSSSSNEIIKKCSLVITISGSAGLEAVFYQKPSIILVDTSYSILQSVYKLQSIGELPQAIRSSLVKEVKISDLNNYVDLINENSFECDIQSLDTSMQNYFHFGGFLADMEIPMDKMTLFLEENHSTLELLASEYIKKLKISDN